MTDSPDYGSVNGFVRGLLVVFAALGSVFAIAIVAAFFLFSLATSSTDPNEGAELFWMFVVSGLVILSIVGGWVVYIIRRMNS